MAKTFILDAAGKLTHIHRIPVEQILTIAEARAATEKRLAAIKAEEEKQAAQAATEIATRNTSPATAPQELFFTGKPYLEETGQYLFLFRHYDPELARWTTPDPSGFPDGANNYLHVNNWYGAIDDTGLQILKFAYSTFIETPYVDFFGRVFNGGQKTWQTQSIRLPDRLSLTLKVRE
jgi:RHS repeat-associated protein